MGSSLLVVVLRRGHRAQLVGSTAGKREVVSTAGAQLVGSTETGSRGTVSTAGRRVALPGDGKYGDGDTGHSYRGTSLIKNTHPPRITMGPYRGTSLIRNAHPAGITIGPQA